MKIILHAVKRILSLVAYLWNLFLLNLAIQNGIEVSTHLLPLLPVDVLSSYSNYKKCHFTGMKHVQIVKSLRISLSTNLLLALKFFFIFINVFINSIDFNYFRHACTKY